MSLGEKIKDRRKQAGLSQEQLAEKLNVSRQAITKWETDKGIPDIANLIAISDEFGLSLDELVKDNVAVKKKIIADSSAKKWHILMIVYLVAIVAYIAYFAICHKILMIGFLIATLFMLFFELRIFIREKIYRQRVAVAMIHGNDFDVFQFYLLLSYSLKILIVIKMPSFQ